MDQESLSEFLADFLLEARERLTEVEAALLDLRDADADRRQQLLATIRRGLHTLKGNSAMLRLDSLRDLAHSLEDELAEEGPGGPPVVELLAGLDRFRAGLGRLARSTDEEVPAAAPARGGEGSLPAGLRVPFSAIDSLVDGLAELIIASNRLAETVRRGSARDLSPASGDREERDALWSELKRADEELHRVVGRMREQVTALRMVPLGTLFARLRRAVHDEAQALGRRVRFEAQGGETPLDKVLLELAYEALGHLVRNAVVHGIEAPELRASRRKSPEGVVGITAELEGGEVCLAVWDDGGGVDRASLAAAARREGLSPADDGGILDLLTHPGLTTRPETDLVAGRGMGLAAVAEAVRRHGGRMGVESRDGIGTRFELRLPLSASIIRALLLEVDGERYALPLRSVVESVRFGAGTRHQVNGAGVLRWRRGVLPLLDLGQALGSARQGREQGFGVVIEAAGKQRALAVDRQLGIEEIVTRRLDPLLGSPAGLSGATTLGDGLAVLVLDPAALVAMSPIAERSG